VRARAALETSCAKNESVGCFDQAILVEWRLGDRTDATRAAELRARVCKGGYARAFSP
jgi:hypothetical protein